MEVMVVLEDMVELEVMELEVLDLVDSDPTLDDLEEEATALAFEE